MFHGETIQLITSHAQNNKGGDLHEIERCVIVFIERSHYIKEI